MNNNRMPRPPLEWQTLRVVEGPEPTQPNNPSARRRRKVACQISTASDGFDHKNKIDRVKFSYKLGWIEDDGFRPIGNIPDERVEEFIEVLRSAASSTKVAHANAIKKVKGGLTDNIGGHILKQAAESIIKQVERSKEKA